MCGWGGRSEVCVASAHDRGVSSARLLCFSQRLRGVPVTNEHLKTSLMQMTGPCVCQKLCVCVDSVHVHVAISVLSASFAET